MILPPRLKSGDKVRVIAPARSLALISSSHREIANSRLRALGLELSFGAHVEECDEFQSSSVRSRVEDLHTAFADPTIKAILTVIGGYNSNQLLRSIDWDVIRKNPKVFCGYSDITALQNAIFRKTGLVTYSGPHYSTFAIEQGFEFSLIHFERCLFTTDPIEIRPSPLWSDDAWYLDQNARHFFPNPGFFVVNEGEAEGTLVGGNLCTFNLLQGTEYQPSLNGTVLFLEEDALLGALTAVEYDRNLQSLIHLPDFSGVQALVLGRFQKSSEMSEEKLRRILASKPELARIPVIAGADFGHTDPLMTFPIGGKVRVRARANEACLTILEH